MNDLTDISKKIDISSLYMCLYAFLFANLILCIVSFLFKETSITLTITAICADLFFALISVISQKFSIKWILWLIFIVNIPNLFNIMLALTYGIPVYILSIGIYRNLKNEYKYFISKSFEEKVNNIFLSTFEVLSGISYFLIFILYSYFEWQIIKNAFWQFLNPFSYLWALWEMLKNPISYFIFYIVALILIFNFVFTVFDEYNKERN